MTIVVVSRGVKSGLEKAVRYLMPALFILLLVMVGYAMNAGAFEQAQAFLFQPDWAELFFRKDDAGAFLLAEDGSRTTTWQLEHPTEEVYLVAGPWIEYADTAGEIEIFEVARDAVGFLAQAVGLGVREQCARVPVQPVERIPLRRDETSHRRDLAAQHGQRVAPRLHGFIGLGFFDG